MTVVIAGGGLIGLGIAWRCLQRGLSVSVVDADFGDSPGSARQPGNGASFAAGGMLAPITEAGYGEEGLLRLCQESLRRYPAFVAELEAVTGRTVSLRTNGTLQVGFDTDDMRALEELHAFHLELGLTAHRLTPGQARRIEPGLTPRLRGAVHVPTDHSVDGRALHAALLAAVVAGGATLVGDRITRLIVHDGRASGVAIAGGGEVYGEQVVLALGSHSGELASLPVRPVGGQILRLRFGGELAGRELLSGTVRALVRGRSVYLVPVGVDGVIVGATSEEKGYRSRVTAGGVFELLRDAIEVVPELAEAELVESIVRYRPGTPDNAPILGPTDLPGLVAATGHYRNGVLLTPVTADAMAQLIATGDLPEVATGFGPQRFQHQLTVHSGASGRPG
jgi:glycine oxidase